MAAPPLPRRLSPPRAGTRSRRLHRKGKRAPRRTTAASRQPVSLRRTERRRLTQGGGESRGGGSEAPPGPRPSRPHRRHLQPRGCAAPRTPEHPRPLRPSSRGAPPRALPSRPPDSPPRFSSWESSRAGSHGPKPAAGGKRAGLRGHRAGSAAPTRLRGKGEGEGEEGAGSLAGRSPPTPACPR